MEPDIIFQDQVILILVFVLIKTVMIISAHQYFWYRLIAYQS